MATVGGLVLALLVVLICVSVLGRGLNTLGHSDLFETSRPSFASWLIGTGVGPVSGDFEIVQAGIAFTIFAFFPLCQFRAGHATVGIFTDKLPKHVNNWLIAFWEVVLAAVMAVIAWRLFVGFQVKLDNGETSLLLQYPLWWSYAVSCAAAAVAAFVSVYCAAARVIEACTGSRLMPSDHEASQ
jgi:hypothetical protein